VLFTKTVERDAKCQDFPAEIATGFTIYIHTHIHTYTHTYIYTHTHLFSLYLTQNTVLEMNHLFLFREQSGLTVMTIKYNTQIHSVAKSRISSFYCRQCFKTNG